MRVSKEVFMIKFKYEINLRKKEFLKLCTLNDYNYKGYLTEQDFYNVLMKFTAYLSDKEIFELIDSSISNGKIRYTEIVNFPTYESDLQYKDKYLDHLNKNRNPKEIKLIETSIRKILSDKDYLSPIQNYQHSVNEENFKINIAKKIFDVLLKSAPKGLESGFIKDVIRQYDFDDDNFYTIGELNNLLIHCNISLDILDLRFLFEKGFTINEYARIKLEDIENFIITYSRQNLKGTLIKDDYYSKYENEEKVETEKIIQNNKVINIFEDCLKTLGKDFLVNYFLPHLEMKESEMINIDGKTSIQKIAFLDSLWLEIGLKNLGYPEIPSSEIGNFKYYLIKNRLTDLSSQTISTIKINFLDLIDHLILKLNIDSYILKQNFDYIKDNLSNNESIDIKESMISKSESITSNTTKLFFKEMEVLFLEKILKNTNYTRENMDKDDQAKQEEKLKFKYTIDEIKFRKEIIKKFGFIDHDIMNDFSRYLSSDLEKKSVVYGENSYNSLEDLDSFTLKNKTSKDDYQIGNIESKKWVKLCYNISFIGMIDKCEELGIILDTEDKIYLSKICEKIKKKIYPSLFNKNYMNLRVNKDNIKKSKSKKDLLKPKDNSEEKIDVLKYLENSKMNETTKNKSDLKFKNVNIVENLEKQRDEVDHLKFKKSRIIANEELYKNINITNVIKVYEIKNKVDSSISIPLLHNCCIDYLVKNYNVIANTNKKIDEQIISKIGVCKIFKDLINGKGKNVSINSCSSYDNVLNRINSNEFYSILIDANISDSIVDFICFYCGKRKQNKNKGNLIHNF